jgi:hypothetical protein
LFDVKWSVKYSPRVPIASLLVSGFFGRRRRGQGTIYVEQRRGKRGRLTLRYRAELRDKRIGRCVAYGKDFFEAEHQLEELMKKRDAYLREI